MKYIQKRVKTTLGYINHPHYTECQLLLNYQNSTCLMQTGLRLDIIIVETILALLADITV